MIVSSLPIWTVDVGGSLLMIVFSFLCVYYAMELRQGDPQNIVWTYLLWVSIALAIFAISRSLGHIVKQLLIITHRQSIWEQLRPYSGAINSLAFMVVGAVTLFFERTWSIYLTIVRDRGALQKAHKKLLYMNQNLENMVTERTTALTLSEHKYRRIFEASKDMILSTAKTSRIIDLNPAGFRLLSLDPDGGIDNLLLTSHFCNPSDWQRLMNEIDRQGFISSTEIDLRTAEGNRRRVVLSGSLAAEASGQHEVIHFLVKDIEQQRLMRDQIAQADKLASIGELSAGIAHEINNPLGVILGFAQLILRNEKDNARLSADIKTIEKHTRHCKSIVEDLLNFARTSTPEKSLCDIHIIIDDVIHFIQQHAKKGEIDFDKAYDRKIGKLFLDEKKIKQVFINLVMNATHAIEEKGSIQVKTIRDDSPERVLIQVIDDGRGIEKRDVTRIFDPFYTTKPTGEGTGLGLSVSYGIIKNHGGHIHVESEPGMGTTFTVELPVPVQP
jgi:two-component system NtrC family sensor kinase